MLNAFVLPPVSHCCQRCQLKKSIENSSGSDIYSCCNRRLFCKYHKTEKINALRIFVATVSGISVSFSLARTVGLYADAFPNIAEVCRFMTLQLFS